ncbi:MAG: carboxypeptidase-like regulatory domain-containing protein [Fermentimonas sp.]|jgi:hypothetical protein
MHRVKPFILLTAAFLISLSLHADTEKGNVQKETGSNHVVVIESVNVSQLDGIIVDAENNETLAGASIIVNGEKYYSDLDGKFTIPHVKSGKQELTIELISYEPVSVEVDGSRDKTITIKLLQK